jgi:hypothetical protein
MTRYSIYVSLDLGEVEFDAPSLEEAKARVRDVVLSIVTDDIGELVDPEAVAPAGFSGCQCWIITAQGPCGEPEAPVNVEYMPIYRRGSHEAAGNRGRWPQNGARRLKLNEECAEALVDGDWTVRVEP